MAENLVIRLQVAVESVDRLMNTLIGAGREPQVLQHLDSLDTQLRSLLYRWEVLTIRASSCTRVNPARILPEVNNDSTLQRVGRPSYDISIPQLEFFRNRMRFTWNQISSMLLVSRTTLWRRVRDVESFSHYYTDITDNHLDECIRRLRQTFPNSGISMMLGHLRSRNIYIQLSAIGYMRVW